MEVKHFGWWDAPIALWVLAITICTISMASTIIIPSLITTRISHFLPISLHISLCLWIPCYHSFTTPSIFKAPPPPPPPTTWFFTTHSRVEENLPPPSLGLDKEVLTLPHSSIFPLPHWLKSKTERWNYLSKTMNKMMWFRLTLE